MGNCYKNTRLDTGDRVFSKSIALEVTANNSKDKLKFKMTDPEKVDFLSFTSPTLDIKTSFCVLPGLDPRGILNKPCQDQVFVISKSDSLLAGVFDGHGKEGRKVVDYCSSFIQTYFNSNNFEDSPKEALTLLIEECDKSLLTESNINCSTSGATVAVLFINSKGIWTSSLGDSRAVLGTLPKHPKLCDISETKSSEYSKSIVSTRNLKPVQITLDQKPNISYELERIKKSGGVVSQITNTEGKKIGPYRVWKEGSQIPGLAMSRSLGDSIAKKIGVISKPIVYYLELCGQRDQFIVMGTDGLWDVMDNKEVITFVDRYRGICPSISHKIKKDTSENNSSISEFLCEEARHRWLGVCKEEDVAIDDIAVIVLDLFIKGSKKGVVPRKGVSNEQIIENIPEAEYSIVITDRFDIRRGSNAVIQEESEEDEED